MFHQTLVKFYLIEGSIVNICNGHNENINPYFNFSIAISNKNGLEQFLSEYMESNQFFKSILTIQNAWLCKTYVMENINIESLNNVQLNNFLWTESSPSLVEQINYIICQLKLESDSLTNLVNSVNMSNYDNVYQWIIVEKTKFGKPFRCEALNLETVDNFNFYTNQVVSIYDDFTIKTTVYSIYQDRNTNSNFFNQNIVESYLDCECKKEIEDNKATPIVSVENDEIILIDIENIENYNGFGSSLWTIFNLFKFW